MLGKKMGSVKKLSKKVKVMGGSPDDHQPTQYECLLIRDDHQWEEGPGTSASDTTPTGFLAVYVGEERRRFVVPTGYLTHPLFKMLLEKAYNEFGFEQKNGLVVPCSVNAFQEVVNAVECCHGMFDFGKLVEEFI